MKRLLSALVFALSLFISAVYAYPSPVTEPSLQIANHTKNHIAVTYYSDLVDIFPNGQITLDAEGLNRQCQYPVCKLSVLVNDDYNYGKIGDLVLTKSLGSFPFVYSFSLTNGYQANQVAVNSYIITETE